MVVEAISLAAAVIGVLWGLWSWLHLRQWSELIAHGHIVVAYKNKVRLNAPLIEWALWIRQLDKDGQARGRVVYQADKSTVMITKSKKASQAGQGNLQAREGTWKATDQTNRVTDVTGNK